MTHLRKLTLEELARRNYSEGTTRADLRIIEDFARYFHRPHQLGPEHIRAYTAHLFRDRKLSDNTVNQMVGGLRFFFLKTLKRPWYGDEMPLLPKELVHTNQDSSSVDPGKRIRLSLLSAGFRVAHRLTV